MLSFGGDRVGATGVDPRGRQDGLKEQKEGRGIRSEQFYDSRVFGVLGKRRSHAKVLFWI